MPADRARLLLALISALLLAGVFVVSDGLFVVDELIYQLSVDALARRGTLAVDNGYGTFGLDGLLIGDFLIPGPNGTVPQYPAGTAALTALPYDLLGPRGMIAVNAVAAVAVLFLTRALGRQLFSDRRVGDGAVFLLLMGTFFLEFTYGVWPHAVALALVLGAFWSIARAVDSETRRGALGGFALAGFLVGLGVHIRSDSILVLGPLAATAILFAARPVSGLIAAGLGLLPGVLAAMAVNSFKFGSLNPLTYGKAGDGGDPLTHLPLMAVAVAGVAGLVLVRVAPGRIKGWLVVAGLAGVVAIGLVVPQIGGLLLRFLTGVQNYILDIRTMSDLSTGVTRDVHGLVRIWDAPKTALGQNMPWLGALLGLPFVLWRNGSVRGGLILTLFVAGWAVPVVMLGWHGGFGFNMRYLMPLLPLISILAVAVWLDLRDRVGLSRNVILSGVIAGLAAFAAMILLAPGGLLAAQQPLATWALAVTALAVLVGAPDGPAAVLRGRVAQGAMAASLALALFYSGIDVMTSQGRREIMAETRETLGREIAGPSLISGLPTPYGFQIGRPDSFIARGDLTGLAKVAEAGVAVWVPEGAAESILRTEPALGIAGPRIETPLGPVVRLNLK